MSNDTGPSSTKSLSGSGVYFQREIVSCVDGDLNCSQTEIDVYFYIYLRESVELIPAV